MIGHEGTVWLYNSGGKRRSALERTGLPELSDLALAGRHDCVMLVGNAEESSIEASRSATSLSPWLMNDSAARVAALRSEEIERRLRREGVPANMRADDHSRSSTPITVLVWGHDAIEMRRSFPDTKKFNEVKYRDDPWNKSLITKEHPIWKAAERTSVRAVYLLGLDYGRVELLLTESGKLIVTEVAAELKMVGGESLFRLREMVQAFSAAWAAETSGGVRVKLGADPEFLLLSREGRVVPASKYFTPKGEAGCDSVRIRGEKRWPLVELRPRPTENPNHLTSDLRRLLALATERTAGASLTWKAGGLPVPGLPLGGHVHLSGAALTGERLRALDNAVALPLRLLEPAEAARRRPRYGSLGDVRRQPHGGFEYRTPPSWLVSPRLALATFALAKVAAEHSRELATDRPLDEERYREAFYSGERQPLLTAVSRIYRAISGTSGYAAYREPIDFLFDAISRGRSWDEGADIRTKWRIPIN
ncbi:putative amidoligase domain-containing protein [Cohnella cholangitidis]|uniref:PhiEco32-like amidoligase-type 2 protein n=1 Tax=Cohnella cholangitidis TaxID=2598458 RepID=A0A7G5C5S7_9BACL|nr:hypothetical protein [Cohnella cholangitidis]QMV44561.1 hypothetical protein FPL14_27875 [Cohnella cholangitidis]